MRSSMIHMQCFSRTTPVDGSMIVAPEIKVVLSCTIEVHPATSSSVPRARIRSNDLTNANNRRYVPIFDLSPYDLADDSKIEKI